MKKPNVEPAEELKPARWGCWTILTALLVVGWLTWLVVSMFRDAGLG